MPRKRTRKTPRRHSSFFARVWAIVARIPRGRVATYGQVAQLAGVPAGARAVGWALRALPEDMSRTVPWHRVVGAGGRIAFREGPGALVQRRLLGVEGVAFASGHVDLAVHGLGVSPRRRPAPRRGRPGAASGVPARGGR